MIRLLLFGLAAVIGGASLAVLIAKDSGYILISIGDTSIEMSFWFGLACLVFFLFALRIGRKIFSRLWEALASSVSWISESRIKRVEKRTNKGLILFVEGNWRAAKKELLAAAKLSDKPLLQYLAAANSAFELGDLEETQFLLHQAEKTAPQNELAISLTQARMEMRDKKYEQALATLKRVAKANNAHPVLLDLLRQVYIKLGDWPALIQLMPQLKAAHGIDKQEFSALEERVYIGQLGYLLAKSIENTKTLKESCTAIWKSLPSHIRKNTRVVEVYARFLLEQGQHELAAQILITILKSDWNAALVDLFGRLKTVGKKEHLLHAESWLREHPGDHVLLLVLGKLARANELWGKAKEYLKKSILLKATPQAYAELASLLAQLGEHEESTTCYHKGLLLSAD